MARWVTGKESRGDAENGMDKLTLSDSITLRHPVSWNSPGRNGTRSLAEPARVRRTRKHPLRLQTCEIV